MDASQSALDSLRTVEFRETLKGYHRDDVDEYLEKAAVEAEGLQEQLRQGGERLRQAAERISAAGGRARAAKPPSAAAPSRRCPTTRCSAPCFWPRSSSTRRRPMPRPRPRRVLAEAECQGPDRSPARPRPRPSRSWPSRRSDCARRSAGSRTARAQLTHEVESMSRHLESERARLRAALADILRVGRRERAARRSAGKRTWPCG